MKKTHLFYIGRTLRDLLEMVELSSFVDLLKTEVVQDVFNKYKKLWMAIHLQKFFLPTTSVLGIQNTIEGIPWLFYRQEIFKRYFIKKKCSKMFLINRNSLKASSEELLISSDLQKIFYTKKNCFQKPTILRGLLQKKVSEIFYKVPT